MSEVSKVVFVAFTQHCIQSAVTHVRGVEGYCTLYTLASGPCQEGRLFIWAFCLGGLAVHHQSVQGGSFVNFLRLVKLQGWLQAKCRANPQFLKLKGTQQPSNSYISMATKLHPPYRCGSRGPQGPGPPLDPRFWGPKIEHFWALFNFSIIFFCLASLGILFL